MIHYQTGDLFAFPADALAHGCNTLGKMNAGIAVEFRNRFPQMYLDYKKKCTEGRFQIGQGYIYKNPSTPHIINLATQDRLHIARLEDIASCLAWLAENQHFLGINSIVMPRIGAGLGNIPWSQVRKELEYYLDGSKLDIVVVSNV